MENNNEFSDAFIRIRRKSIKHKKFFKKKKKIKKKIPRTHNLNLGIRFHKRYPELRFRIYSRRRNFFNKRSFARIAFLKDCKRGTRGVIIRALKSGFLVRLSNGVRVFLRRKHFALFISYFIKYSYKIFGGIRTEKLVQIKKLSSRLNSQSNISKRDKHLLLLKRNLNILQLFNKKDPINWKIYARKQAKFTKFIYKKGKRSSPTFSFKIKKLKFKKGTSVSTLKYLYKKKGKVKFTFMPAYLSKIYQKRKSFIAWLKKKPFKIFKKPNKTLKKYSKTIFKEQMDNHNYLKSSWFLKDPIFFFNRRKFFINKKRKRNKKK
jgi:hypothetical protein